MSACASPNVLISNDKNTNQYLFKKDNELRRKKPGRIGKGK